MTEQKGMSTRKRRGRASQLPVPSSTNTSKCEQCKKTSKQWLECEKCEKWWCSVCTYMSVEFHEFVGKCDNFHWFCNTCNVGIDELWNQEETPKQVPEPILKSIDSKITDVLEIVKDMKSKVTCIESESNDMKKSYADMFKASAATVSKENDVDLGRKSTQKDREALSEYADRERRSRCIIIHGVPESTKSALTDKRAEDHKNVKDILNNVLEIADVSIINLYRLGGKGQNRNLKPRLLLATLNSKDKQHEALANTWKLKGNQEWKKVYVDPDRTPEQRKEHNKLLEEMRARRNNGEQVFLAQGKIKVRRQHFAREDNGAANVTSKVKDNGSNKVSENHKEDVAQRSGADTKHETNRLDDQQAEDKQPVADAQQQNVVLDNNTLHATRV